mmetsp:Transcript_38549/g.46602  ORF Transcript_38549/g.46602 Transcript_38549/m.46602 type:complete len:770 (+) Transcript_38549:354-2663(+)|eukprot:CAMPEP_0197851502 /NCGR_PEP_ID=MMETSP1438-20131217/18251_1 /TAXON_ID=1461541 /ORGANISM="Pterosperma sp., Strain CCMP1384" /LENGTH=769 /DNA_ID=CAMNT_0043465121 /DNA_START=337 /DNA_END=2646 /DNA_ORIENTATION=-
MLDDYETWDESPPSEAIEDVKQKSKTGEEIERYIVDENISDLDLVCQFLSSGNAIQQQNAIRRLEALFQEYHAAGEGRKAFDAIQGPLETAMVTYDSDSHVDTSNVFIEVVNQQLLTKQEIADCLLPIVLNVLNNNRDREVLDGWLNALYTIVPVVDVKLLKKEVTALALSKGEVDETVQSRVVCCKVLGAIVPQLDRESIEFSFFSKAMALCQDTDYEVRICMCEQLDPIARAVGAQLTKDSIMPEVFELLNDEEAGVRMAAFECIINMFDIIPADIRKDKMFGIIKEYCTAQDEVTLQCIARLFGPLMTKVAPEVEKEDDWAIFLQSYKGLAGNSDAKLRELAAFNFPAVLKAMGPRKYAMHLHASYMQLCNDTNEDVRACIACSFHEVSKMLGKERGMTYLKDAFLSLLQDQSQEVQNKILGNLATMLGMFAVTNEQDRISAYAEVLPAVLHVEASMGRNWRMLRELVLIFPSCTDYFTSDQVYENIIPLCFRYLAAGAAPIKTATAAALPLLLRRTRKIVQRNDIIQRLMREYARAKSCFGRQLYVELAENLLAVFSSKFFRDNFLEEAVNLLQDPVPNVRMKACLLLPQLKRTVKLPDDVELLERMSKYCTALTTDNDRDVAASARSIVEDFKVTPTHGVKKDPTMSAQEFEEFDATDKQKEKEEEDMLSKEEVDNKKLSEAAQKERRARLSDSELRIRARLQGTGNRPGLQSMLEAASGRSSAGESSGPAKNVRDYLSSREKGNARSYRSTTGTASRIGRGTH